MKGDTEMFPKWSRETGTKALICHCACKIWKICFKRERHQLKAVGAQMIPALLLKAAKS
jgi:hypothetical protein